MGEELLALFTVEELLLSAKDVPRGENLARLQMRGAVERDRHWTQMALVRGARGQRSDFCG